LTPATPRVFLDLREAGETCSKHRVARLMRANNIRAVRGYSRKPKSGAKPSELAPNVLRRQCTRDGRSAFTAPKSDEPECQWLLPPDWNCDQQVLVRPCGCGRDISVWHRERARSGFDGYLWVHVSIL
jgi:transposase InsO family protein